MGASRRVGGDSRSHAAEDMSETTAAGVSGYNWASVTAFGGQSPRRVRSDTKAARTTAERD